MSLAAAEPPPREKEEGGGEQQRTVLVHPFCILVPDADHRRRVCAFSQLVNKTFNVKDAVQLYSSRIPVQRRWARHLRIAAGTFAEGLELLSLMSKDAYALKFICAPLMLLLKLVNAQDDMRMLCRWNANVVLVRKMVPIDHPVLDKECPMPSTSICRADLRVVDPSQSGGWESIPEHAAVRPSSPCTADTTEPPLDDNSHECRYQHQIIVDMTSNEKMVIRQYKSTDIVRVNIRGDTAVLVMSCGPTCGVGSVGLGYLSLIVAYACSSQLQKMDAIVRKCVLADASNIIDTRKFDAVPAMSHRFVSDTASVDVDPLEPGVHAVGPGNDIVVMHSCNIAGPAWYVAVEPSDALEFVPL